MDKKELELIDSIDQKDLLRKKELKGKERIGFKTIWEMIQELAENCSVKVNRRKLDYSKINKTTFSKKIAKYTAEEKKYINECFFFILDELVIEDIRKKNFLELRVLTPTYKIAYSTDESFILEGIETGVINNLGINKIKTIFGDYYSARNIYNYTGGNNSIGQSQRNKLIRDGIITKLSVTGRSKYFIHEDKIRDFIEIRIKHYIRKKERKNK